MRKPVSERPSLYFCVSADRYSSGTTRDCGRNSKGRSRPTRATGTRTRTPTGSDVGCTRDLGTGTTSTRGTPVPPVGTSSCPVPGESSRRNQTRR